MYQRFCLHVVLITWATLTACGSPDAPSDPVFPSRLRSLWTLPSEASGTWPHSRFEPGGRRPTVKLAAQIGEQGWTYLSQEGLMSPVRERGPERPPVLGD